MEGLLLLRTLIFALCLCAPVLAQSSKWSPLEIEFDGPRANELDANPNPFLDYRLTVTFTSPSLRAFQVPGFFDGDGNGAGGGSVWRVRFLPDEAGTWAYSARFRAGPEIALSLDPNAGQPTGHDTSSLILVSDVQPTARGFFRNGTLRHVGQHYYRFDDGEYFLKSGANSPENLLGYLGFDNTFNQPGGVNTPGLQNGLHRFLPHTGDMLLGDPYFVSEDSGYDSRGIIGALNYLSRSGVNSIYFLPMNMGGDGRETVPFTGYGSNAFDKTHYDVSKLGQWNLVFRHAQNMGILLHFVLAETEIGNKNWLDAGQLGTERKLFYRELIARFGYLPAIQWNLSEESQYLPSRLRQFADWILALDPYDHPVTFHTLVLPVNGAYADYDAVLGEPRFEAASLQSHSPNMGGHVEKWRGKSAASGQPWVIGADEIAPAGQGLGVDNIDYLRKEVLYDVYFSGGNIEWYCGSYAQPLGGDLTMEDFRTREQMWKQTTFARRMLETLPFWQMEPMDGLVTGESSSFGGAEVFAIPGRVYAVYLPDATPGGQLAGMATEAIYQKRWFNPRSGEFEGWTSLFVGSAQIALGKPPHSQDEDWVCLIEAVN